jgi:hypothetical protein
MSAARRSMEDLLKVQRSVIEGEVERSDAPAAPAAPEGAQPRRKPQQAPARRPAPSSASTPESRPARPTKKRAAAPSKQTARKPAGRPPAEVPKWQTLERKEVLLRPGQLDELTALRRIVNRRRNGAGERITENTLIRVAVDLLLASESQLSGTTEDELRESLTPVRRQRPRGTRAENTKEAS